MLIISRVPQRHAVRHEFRNNVITTVVLLGIIMVMISKWL